ncbi:MAG: hypothetical protein WC768_02290 [Patescibacteria group bacterium]|jgi:hypothetical protein
MAQPALKISNEELPELNQPVRKTSAKQPGDNIVDFNEYKRNLNKNQLADRRQEADQKTAPEKLGSGIQKAGQAAELAGAGAQLGGKAMQLGGKGAEVAGGAIGGDLGAGIGGAAGAVGGAIAGSVVPGAGTLAGAAAGARSGASGGAKIGQQVGRLPGEGLQAAGKGVEQGGKAVKEAGKNTKGFGRQLRQQGNMAKRLLGNKGNKKDSAESIAESLAAKPTQLASSKLLQQSWLNLIDTFGISYFYIAFHFIAAYFTPFSNLFCKFGEEWLPKVPGPAGEAAKKASKPIELLEILGCVFIGLLLLLIISVIAFIIAFLGYIYENPWNFTWNALIKPTSIEFWQYLKSLVGSPTS